MWVESVANSHVLGVGEGGVRVALRKLLLVWYNPPGTWRLVGQEDWGREHFWVFGKGANIGGPPGSQQLHQAQVTVFL